MVCTLVSTLEVPQIIKHQGTIGPEIRLLDTCLRELKAYVHTQMCTQMFVATIFTMAQKKWK